MTRNGVIASVLFLIAFGLYVHGAYPSVSVGDSGEFIAASHTLGVPHAPGYPTYLLLAKTFQTILPFGNMAYRTNLFSAVCGALTVSVLFILCIRLGLGAWVAIPVAIGFLLSPAHMTNSQASEVFALHVLFCAAVLIAALKHQWVVAAILAGIGLGNHQTLLLIFPGLAFLYFSIPPAERPSLPYLIAGFLGGLSIYGLLSVRAAASPLLNSGDPDSLQKLWKVFTRADYGSLTLALGETPARTLPNIALQLQRFLSGLKDQVTWVGLLLGVWGIVWAIGKRHVATLSLTIAFAFMGPFFFVLGNLPFDAQSLGLLERFYIAPTLLWALLAAVGLNVLCSAHRWPALGFLLVPGWLWTSRVEAFPLRHDYRAYSYGLNNLRTLPLHSVFLMDGGDDTFYTLAYLTQVERRRPDLTLHDRGGVVFPGFYGDDFRKLTREEKEQRRAHVEHARVVSGSILWYSTMNERIVPAPTYELQGLLYGPKRSEKTDLWALYDLRGISPWMTADLRASPDYRTRALVPYYAYQRSVEESHRSEPKDLEKWALAAYLSGPDVLWLLPNVAQNAYEWAHKAFTVGRLEVAEKLYRLITLSHPSDANAWSDLGAIAERQGDLPLAIERYQTAIRLDSRSEQAHYNLAVAYWKLSDWKNVQAELQKVLEINPNHAAARNYLMLAQQRLQPKP